VARRVIYATTVSLNSYTCLARRNWVGGPHTQVDTLLARLPQTPPVPELLVVQTPSAPPELLLATPTILYDASA
jgi:hypothetical protein